MEAYGGVASIAENILKKAASIKVAKDEAKNIANETQWNEQALSDKGSSSNTGAAGSFGPVDTKYAMLERSKQKAMESLNAKIESIKGQNLYLSDLVKNQNEQIEGLSSQNKTLEDKLGRQLMKKGK